MVFTRKNKRKKMMTLKNVTMLLAQLKLPLVYVFTPTNLQEERKKFFASDIYNPQFRYKIVSNSNEKVLKQLIQLDGLSDVDPRMSDFYIELIKQKDLTNKLMQSVGDNEKLTKYARQKYGVVSPILYRNACRILRGKLSMYTLSPNITQSKLKISKKLGFNEIKEVIDMVFQELGLIDWKAEKSKKSANSAIKTGLKKRRVYISPDIQKSAIELRKTIVHEIGTHVLRHINGLSSGFEALSKPNLQEYLDTEEGLAMYNEERMGLLSEKSLKKRALYVWLSNIGDKLSFRQLYDAVYAFKPRKEAFNIVLRMKRGLGDTSKPGLYCKDVVYLRGFRRVRKSIRENPKYYQYLYAAKISLKQVRWVEEGLLPKPRFVPDEAMFENIFKICGI